MDARVEPVVHLAARVHYAEDEDRLSPLPIPGAVRVYIIETSSHTRRYELRNNDLVLRTLELDVSQGLCDEPLRSPSVHFFLQTVCRSAALTHRVPAASAARAGARA